jgi:hypothetical protein
MTELPEGLVRHAAPKTFRDCLDCPEMVSIPMRVVIFGAAGKTAGLIVDRALAKGHGAGSLASKFKKQAYRNRHDRTYDHTRRFVQARRWGVLPAL